MMQGKLLAANMGYRLLNVALVFVINILLSRLAGVSGYGLLSLLVANAGIFNMLSAFGADAGITFHAASGTMPTRKLMSFLLSILLFQLLAACLTEAVSYFITGHLWLVKTANLQYWWLGIVFVISISMVEKYTALLYGQHLFTRCSKVIVSGNLLMLGLFAFFYFNYPGKSVIFYIVAFVLMNLLQACLLAFSFHRYAGNALKPTAPAGQDIKVFFSYSILTFIINIIQFLAYRVDYWLLDYYKGEQELGWYSLAVRLLQLFWVLPLLFASIIFPVVASKPATGTEEKMLALLRGMNWLNLLAGLLSFFLVPVLLPFLFGREYDNSVSLFQLLLPGVLLFCMATLLAAYYAGQKKLKINLFGSLLCLAVILTLDIILIPSKGMKGAAIASSIGYAVTAFYYIIVYCYSNKVSVARLFIPRQTDWNYTKNIFRKGS